MVKVETGKLAMRSSADVATDAHRKSKDTVEDAPEHGHEDAVGYKAPELPGIKLEQDAREDPSSREGAPKSDHASGLGNPIKIAANADHYSEEEEHDCDVRGTLG